ncbi:GNAT family N-acetyltransferase [Flavobacteriales bacterium]|nr:GNAT family N-acetyltransferase [Flavobacteriales bacterium]
MTPTTFHTARFTIRPYCLNDKTRFVEMGTDKEVVRFMGGADGDKVKQAQIFQKIFNLYSEPETNETKLFWAIAEANKLVGHVQLKQTIFTEEDELEIVYMIHPDARNHGVMSEVLDFFKSNQQLWGKRIIATADFDNDISFRLLENWGIEKRDARIDPDDGVQFWKIWLKQE